MKKLLFLFLVSSNAFKFCALEARPLQMQEEMAHYRAFVELMRTNLREAESFVALMEEYGSIRAAYLGEPDNAQKASKLVKKARVVQEALETLHLDPYFSTDLREEVAFFASLTGKKG